VLEAGLLLIRPSTFSIVAYDPVVPAWGVAVASKFPAVGAVVPWAAAGAGAVATQAYANTTFGPQGLDQMRAGASAEQALRELLAADEGRDRRQAGLVDAFGRTASYTGPACQEWAGGRADVHFAAQGNILVGPQVIDAMAEVFATSPGDLPDRLVSALLAGDRAGGDRRGRQSAALLVVKAGGGYAGFNDRWIDYRVDDHPDPVPRLAELLELHRLYFGESPEADRLPLEGDVVVQLKRMMARLGTYTGPVDGRLEPDALRSLERFIGNENFEDRTDLKRLLIDRPVFEHLLRRYGGG
jgi:uncharacterized Ntn-hydrolase superfamily protein